MFQYTLLNSLPFPVDSKICKNNDIKRRKMVRMNG